MEKLIYVDTNIYIDYFENRSDKYRNFSDEATWLFERAINCEFKIVVSYFIIKELKKFNFLYDFKEFIVSLQNKNKVIFVKLSLDEVKKAKDIK